MIYKFALILILLLSPTIAFAQSTNNPFYPTYHGQKTHTTVVLFVNFYSAKQGGSVTIANVKGNKLSLIAAAYLTFDGKTNNCFKNPVNKEDTSICTNWPTDIYPGDRVRVTYWIEKIPYSVSNFVVKDVSAEAPIKR